MSWFGWITLGAITVVVVLAGLRHFLIHKNALQALQVAAETAIGLLAVKGLPEEASNLGKTIGDHMKAAGPVVKRLNDALHRKAKAKITETTGKSTRELIADAFRKKAAREPQP